MANKKASYFIGLNFGDFTLVVRNAREVYGHDDSLPYNAEFDLLKNRQNVCAGKAWNDGWGGMSNYSIDNNHDEAHKVINEIDSYGVEHIKYKWGEYEITLKFIDIIDQLVDLSLDGKGANCGHIFTERALLNYLKSM